MDKGRALKSTGILFFGVNKVLVLSVLWEKRVTCQSFLERHQIFRDRMST